MPPIILGIARFHDVGAALFVDGKVAIVAEAERVLDVKHARGTGSVPPAVVAALDDIGLNAGDIDAVVVADTHGEGIECRSDWGMDSHVRGWASVDKELIEHTHGPSMAVPLGTVSAPGRLQMGRLDIPGLRDDLPVYGACHHGAHAASAIYMSGFDDCGVLVVDGYGVCSGSIGYRYRNGACERLESTRDMALLGWRYSLFGHLAKEILPGTDSLDLAGKVMGLNAYGTPQPHLVAGLTDWFRLGYDDYLLTFDWSRRWFAGLLDEAGIGRGEGSVEDKRFLDLIASMQEAFSICMVDMAKRTIETAGTRRLALAGGCALNVLANSRIAELPGLDELFVIPCSGDGGLPMGAAVIGAALLTGEPLHQPSVPAATRRNAYLGVKLIDDVIETPSGLACSAAPMEAEVTAVRVAELLEAKKVVGIAWGTAELGPRALGHRSILASGIDPSMRERLNQIKHREWWRPFAPVCRSIDADRYFEGPLFSEYMLTSVTVREPYRTAFAAAAHEDGTARLQILPDRETNPLVWDILTAFEARTGIGVLINTSFNLGGKPLLNRASTATGMVTDGKLDAAWVEGRLYSLAE